MKTKENFVESHPTNPTLTRCPTCKKWRNRHRKFNELNECRNCWKLKRNKEKRKTELHNISIQKVFSNETRRFIQYAK